MRRPRLTPTLAFAAAAAAAVACDRRPVVADTTAALSPPGTAIPEFSFEGTNQYTKFDRSRLKLGHTLLALVPGNATGQERGLVAFDSIKSAFPMFRFAVVHNRPMEPSDTHYLNPPPWLFLVERGFANDSLIAATFAAGLRDSSDKHRRPVYALPSFLVISDSARVLGRSAGTPAPLRPILDSLKNSWQAARDAEAAVVIARGKPVIESGLSTFDPDSLVAPRLRLNNGCGGEESADGAIIPALGRLISIEGRHPGLIALVEFTSVADVKPIGGQDLCSAQRLAVKPRVSTARYRVSFFELAQPTDTTSWTIDTSFEPDSSNGNPRYILIGLGDRQRKLELPADVTIATLRARIDSIRKAAQP